MKISISNIAWKKEQDEEMYKYISDHKLDGIEIAPTRIIEEQPYENIEKAVEFAKKMKEVYNLEISSMQSIWYGKQGNIFNKEDAKMFIEYTKKSIDFAEAIGCKNLVFGCPKNRNIPQEQKEEEIIYFFRKLGEYAKAKKTIITIEPNPTIYGTNFINTTKQAFDFVKKINCEGIKVNVDFGTIIENKEDLNIIFENINLVNHIHISEPNLVKVEKRKEHQQLSEFLKSINYDRYISIEMKQTESIEDVKEVINYVSEIFHREEDKK